MAGSFFRASSGFAVFWIAIFCALVALKLAQYVLAPVFLGIVVGLMLMPAARRLERLGTSSYVSSALTVTGFLCIVIIMLYGLSLPLNEWMEKLPLIWNRFTLAFSSWQQALLSVGNLKGLLDTSVLTDETIKLEIDKAEAVRDVAIQVPALFGQIVIFFASLYFYLATREKFRSSILTICLSQSLRYRVARIFRDIEFNISSYLAQITLINAMLGLATGCLLWALGVPSPALWGALAALLNFVIYIGPAMMVAILLMVGLSIGGSPIDIILPALAFLGLNLVEANFVTPNLIGKYMTMNPFVIFLSLVFWIWIWGPVGGFIAVPALLIFHAVMFNLIDRSQPQANPAKT